MHSIDEPKTNSLSRHVAVIDKSSINDQEPLDKNSVEGLEKPKHFKITHFQRIESFTSANTATGSEACVMGRPITK